VEGVGVGVEFIVSRRCQGNGKESRNNKHLYFSELLCQHWRLEYKVGMGFCVALVLWGGDVR